jgi:DNA-binding transcriptional regulator YdaS (Cro superfamily)
MDPWRGSDSDPATLHRYTYASSDPVRQVDPSGQFSLGEGLAVAAAIVILASIAYAVLGGRSRRTVVVDWSGCRFQGQAALGEADRELVMKQAMAVLARAYAGWNIQFRVGAYGMGRHNVKVVNSYTVNCGGIAAGGCTHSSKDAEIAYGIHDGMAWQLGRHNRKSNAEIVEAIGTALGHTTAHEVAHEVLWEDPRHRELTDQTSDGTKLEDHPDPSGADIMTNYNHWFGTKTWGARTRQALQENLGAL